VPEHGRLPAADRWMIRAGVHLRRGIQIEDTGRHPEVRDILRQKILSGELASGAMVPSIVTIHQEYGIAKTTARKVLAALRDEGLIITTPGWGSFVAGTDTKQT
jgi:DNA-binding GntR family transcriptional regulator